MDFINKLKGEKEKTVEEVNKFMTDSGAELEGAFEQLKKNGKDNADGIVQWMKDAKIIVSKESEAKARELLGKDPKKKISFQQLKETVLKLVQEHTQSKAEELGAMLKDHSHRLTSALQAGTSAFKEALGTPSNTKDGAAKK